MTIIHVEDGLVQAVYSTDPGQTVRVIDVDNLKEEGKRILLPKAGDHNTYHYGKNKYLYKIY